MKIDVPSYFDHTMSKKYKTVEAAKDYVKKNKKKYVWLNEFERKGEIVSAEVLAISPLVLKLMNRMGIAKVEEDIVGKQMFGWFNRFAEYMMDKDKGEDEEGGFAFKQAQQGMYGLTLQHKQVVPLSVSIRIKEPGSKEEYLTLVMSEEFVTEGERDVILITAKVTDITQEAYKSLKDAKDTVKFVLSKGVPYEFVPIDIEDTEGGAYENRPLRLLLWEDNTTEDRRSIEKKAKPTERLKELQERLNQIKKNAGLID